MRARLLYALLVPAIAAPILIGVGTAAQAAAVNNIQSTDYKARTTVTLSVKDAPL